MVMMTAAYHHEVNALKAAQDHTRAVRQARIEADKIIEQVKQSLELDTAMKSITRQCGDDTCIDLYIQFKSNQAKIENANELEALKRASGQLKDALERLPADQRKDIEIVIEGHTDNIVPDSELLDERGKYLYNWELSSRRAVSVAYEFKQKGLTPDKYRIVAIGYAASMPLCEEETPACRDKNRRTTLILRGDTRQIEKRLSQQQQQQQGAAAQTNTPAQ
jgi:outer membrane protein OmpA-like peptidoglycan-associated protein